MGGSEIEQFKQQLLKLREELMALERASQDATASAKLGVAGLPSRGAVQAQLMAEEGTRRRKRQLQKIDGALRRIEAGEYGRCFICEKAIDTLRLSEDPTITRCVDCVEE